MLYTSTCTSTCASASASGISHVFCIHPSACIDVRHSFMRTCMPEFMPARTRRAVGLSSVCASTCASACWCTTDSHEKPSRNIRSNDRVRACACVCLQREGDCSHLVLAPEITRRGLVVFVVCFLDLVVVLLFRWEGKGWREREEKQGAQHRCTVQGSTRSCRGETTPRKPRTSRLTTA
jgi:hypothetical protein